jgi:hypothetical protein
VGRGSSDDVLISGSVLSSASKLLTNTSNTSERSRKSITTATTRSRPLGTVPAQSHPAAPCVHLRKAMLDPKFPVDLVKEVTLIAGMGTRSNAAHLAEAACSLLCQVLQKVF